MPVTVGSFTLGALLAALVAWGAVRLGYLTRGGGLAAFVIGSIVFGIGGIPYSVPMIVFFGSSSFLTRVGRRRKRGSLKLTAKAGPRDGWQVLANGGPATLIALLSAIMPAGGRPSSRDWFLLYTTALAAVNADTWATEIGALSRGMPRLITTLRPVRQGTSGAISVLGLCGALAGSAVIVLSSALSWPSQSQYFLWQMDPAEALAIVWAGFLASLVDSVLGASAQGQYRCSECGAVSESSHHCGHTAVLIRGRRWIGNDAVNAIASAVGVAAGWYLLVTFAWPMR